MTKAQSERVIAVCEEFTDIILFDDIHKSVIINITVDRFPTLRRELKRYRYNLIHMSRMEDTETITCVFIQG